MLLVSKSSHSDVLCGAQGNQVMFLVTKSSLHDVPCGAQGNKVLFFVTKSSLYDVLYELFDKVSWLTEYRDPGSESYTPASVRRDSMRRAISCTDKEELVAVRPHIFARVWNSCAVEDASSGALVSAGSSMMRSSPARRFCNSRFHDSSQ